MTMFNTMKYARKIRQYAKNEIYLQYKEKKPDKYFSKLGGKPLVPKDFVWPYYTGEDFDGIVEERPLTLVASINLEEASFYDVDHLLPSKGLLLFFYDLHTMPAGLEAKDQGCARVYYFPDLSILEERDYPKDLDEEFIIPELSLNLSQQLSFPTYCEIDGLDEKNYQKICRKYNPYFLKENNFKLLGYPDIIQDEMEGDCETIYQGYDNSYTTTLVDQKKIQAHKHEWIFLFQCNSICTKETDIMFGDFGSIYYWIKKEDLKNKDFSHIWLILQCF